jgi:single-stranded DNA-specific DHH superfamily exonuclease
LKTYCLSHRKDVDGLGSGSISVAATGGQIILSDYDDMLENLRKVPDDAERVVMTDLSVDSADFPDILREIKRITKNAEVTLIDHHYMSNPIKLKLRKAKVKVVHDITECASVLAYLTFKDKLPEEARLNALYGAVTDYMDNAPVASKMMERAERHTVLLEATLLSLSLGETQEIEGFREMVVNELAKMKRPHEVQGVAEAGLRQLGKEAAMEAQAKAKGVRKGPLAYVYIPSEESTSVFSKLILGAFDVRVGVALKEGRAGFYEVSLRCTSECRVHLGTTIGRISKRLGGSGGGHKRAAGCRIPKGRADEMIAALAKKV